MIHTSCSIIVPGSLNTDLTGLWVPAIVWPGELAFWGELQIGPGGKSRNMAQMISTLVGKWKVTMLGKTSRDPYGLWKAPLDALKKSGVNTDFVTVENFQKAKKFPGIAMIPVDQNGKNQIYVLPGINSDFWVRDIQKATPLFKNAGTSWILCMSLELPRETALEALKMAHKHGLRIILDPGGINKGTNNDTLFKYPLYCLKPNEHEAGILSWIKVTDEKSAKQAVQILLKKGVENVFITVWKNGAYFWNASHFEHIPAAKINTPWKTNETGCGDQTTAALCAYISFGTTIKEAARIAVLAGGIQFHTPSIEPVTKKEIEKWKK